MLRTMTLGTVLAVCLGTSSAARPTAPPAMPYAWVFVGGALEEPLAIVGWDDSLTIMEGFYPFSRPTRRPGRLYLSAALLARAQWDTVAADSLISSDEIVPSYRFYPATESEVAILVGPRKSWWFSSEALTLLKTRGVPVDVAGLRPTFIAPAIIMFYGGSLPEPIFIVYGNAGDIAKYAGLICAAGSEPVTPQLVGDRPYLNMAMFWNYRLLEDREAVPALLPTLRPENAHQHGRLYLPQATVGASVLTTRPRTTRITVEQLKLGESAMATQPVPTTSGGFERGCWLTQTDIDTAKAVGIPGLQNPR